MTQRRHKGDGGLYQRHDAPDCPPLVNGERAPHTCHGRWVGTIETTLDGTRKRKTVYGRTKREAQAKLKEALKQRDAGTLVVSTLTVEGWLNYWLENIAAHNLKPQTLRGYKSSIKVDLIPRLGRIKLANLRPEHIRALHDWMRKEGKADGTLRQAHAVLRKALRDAMYDGKIPSNPADRVKSPSTKAQKREQLTLDQARAVLRAAGSEPRWWLALFYGMRQGEVLGLQWGDVDFDEGLLRIRRTLQTAVDGSLIMGEPKSSTSVRTLPLMPQIAVRLRLLYEAQGKPGADVLIFPRASGGPKDPRRDWKEWKELLTLATIPPWAPIPPIALHAARNSAASLLEAAGVPDRLAMQILGHSQVQMTHRYQTADVDRMRQALEGTSRLLELE